MQYRKFRLQNSNDTYYNLTDHNFKVFANNPSGLGFSKTLSILRLGDENLIPYSMVNLDNINFEILFYDDKIVDKYQKYQDFINFLSYKPIYLLYQRPNSFKWYRRRVEITSLTKTEVNFDDSMLHCPMQMLALTFWEDEENNVIKLDNNESSDGKVYPITYPIVYGSYSLSNIDLQSLGMLEAPLQITIDGEVTNPQYLLYDEYDNIYGRGKFNGTFDKVYVNSIESNEEILLERNGTILDNPMGYQDLTIGSPNEIYVTFLQLKTGKSKLRFIVDQGFTGNVTIEWRNRYVSI